MIFFSHEAPQRLFVIFVSNVLFVSNTIDLVCFCCPCIPSRYICCNTKRLCPDCCLAWHSVSPKVAKLFSKYRVMAVDLLPIIFLFRKINKNNPLPTPLLRQKQRQSQSNKKLPSATTCKSRRKEKIMLLYYN